MKSSDGRVNPKSELGSEETDLGEKLSCIKYVTQFKDVFSSKGHNEYEQTKINLYQKWRLIIFPRLLVNLLS